MKKLLYIGHNYHQKTKSTQFLIELLKKNYIIDFISFNPYKNEYLGVEETKGKRYDVLFVLQIMPDMQFLESNFNFKQGVLVPMYDYIVTRQYDPWPEYRHFKIISFSKTMHEQLIERGFNSYYIQYFPEPMEGDELGNPQSVFFWQRLERIDFNLVKSVLSNYDIVHYHLHKALDPNQKFLSINCNDENRISYSEWFEDANEMKKIMLESAFYIAPRLYEGIGMSFLEAMAAGRCVVAPNLPTMSEYIIHGVNGLLYDVDNPQPIDIYDIVDIQEKAKETIKEGYERWSKSKEHILDWISEEPEQPLVTIVTVEKDVIKAGRERTFRQCMESVHCQSYANIEHLIIDGASTDSTLQLLDSYKKLGWIDYVSGVDSGMYEAMNKGIRLAKGKYVVFLNTDDYFHNTDAVWESVYSLENSGADFSFASNRLMEENGSCNQIRHPDIGSFVAQMPFCHQTMFTKKDVLMEIGLFNEKYKSSADYDLVLRVILKGYTYIRVETDIVTYRRGGVSEAQQERADAEKRDIFINLYSKYYLGTNMSEFAFDLAGRKCPDELYNNLINSVSPKLAESVKQSIVKRDEKNRIIYFPEEIIEDVSGVVGGLVTKSATETIDIKRREERLNKFVQYFALLDRWLWLRLQNKNIDAYFVKNGIKKIAIYGIGEIGNRLYEDLSRNTSIEVAYAIDRKISSHIAIPVYKIGDSIPKVDAIVVSTNNIFDSIREELKKVTDISIVSIDDIINEVE